MIGQPSPIGISNCILVVADDGSGKRSVRIGCESVAELLIRQTMFIERRVLFLSNLISHDREPKCVARDKSTRKPSLSVSESDLARSGNFSTRMAAAPVPIAAEIRCVVVAKSTSVSSAAGASPWSACWWQSTGQLASGMRLPESRRWPRP